MQLKVQRMAGVVFAVLAAIATPVWAQQQTGSSTSVFVSPGTQQYHDSAVKAWAYIQNNSTVTMQASYGVSIASRAALGRVTISLTTAMATSNYAIIACVNGVSNSDRAATVESGQTSLVFTVATHTATPNLVDQDFSVMVLGRQA